jgi:hypothetical protein
MKPARQAFNDPQSKTKQRSRQESTYHYPIHVEWGIVGVVAEKSHSQEKQQGRNEPKEQYQNGVESVSCVVNDQWPVNSRHENKTTQQDTRQNWRTWRRKWRVHSERRLRAQQPAKYGCEHRCCLAECRVAIPYNNIRSIRMQRIGHTLSGASNDDLMPWESAKLCWTEAMLSRIDAWERSQIMSFSLNCFCLPELHQKCIFWGQQIR